MLHLSNLCLVALVFFYSLNLGPMMFESFTSDRTWASNPPESFYMFLGKYRTKDGSLLEDCFTPGVVIFRPQPCSQLACI